MNDRHLYERAVLEYAIHRPELVAASDVRSGALTDPVLREAFAALERAHTFDQALELAGPEAAHALLDALYVQGAFVPWVILRQELAPCPDCDATGWSSFPDPFVDGDLIAARCPTCTREAPT